MFYGAVNLEGQRWTVSGDTTLYKASTMWLVCDALLYNQDGLVATTSYTVNISANDPNVGGLKFCLNSTTVFANPNVASTNTSSSVPSGSSRVASGPGLEIGSPAHQSYTGKMVAGVVCAIAGLTIIAGAFVCYLCRERAAAAAREPPIAPSRFADLETTAVPTSVRASTTHPGNVSVDASPLSPLPSKLATEQIAAATRMNPHPIESHL
ncbi:hypothetical protein BD311DRAFT_860911 [Dichomitus squalens]|uniref:Uncharacterized protein n=1 Tax=Dichomitus squalens TaxID=114155 RepID=A0A4Q9N2L7_9APHY|nr:hypothetical protein BD311DRAFT_860911 [Dichomitus squalens]